VNALLIVEEFVAYFKRITKPVNRRITELFTRLEKASTLQLVGFLFLYTFLIAAPMLVGFQIDGDLERELDKDIKIFRDRAQTILDGELLYRDTEWITVTPPVINYLFVPAVLLGDTAFVWMAWFTFFLFLTSTVIYFTLEPFFDKKTAIAGSMLFSGSPFGQYTSVAMLQDDAIIVAFLSLSLMFILRKKWYWAATALSLGTLTKLFPALCSPLAVLGPESPIQRIKIAVYGLSIGLLISLPFLILAQTEFLQFIEFYLLGVQPTSSGNVSVNVSLIEQRGMSFWRFFAESIFMIPSIVLHSILLLSLLSIWGSAWLKKIDMMSAFTLCILAVFIFYSKIHYGYHIMLLSVLIPWSMHDAKRLWGLFGASLLAGVVHYAWRDRLFTDNVWVHTLIAFALWCYWVNWARIILQNPNFESYCGEKRTNNTILITTGWIIVLCLLFTIQLGLRKAFF
tara:strand:- start:690 stop:2054 length:1365 start_codon:yes stop_codon:yes gene_type:complete